MKIQATDITIYYDGPVEFVGQLTDPDEWRRTVFGFVTNDTDITDDHRRFSVWTRRYETDEMESLGIFDESDIDWSHAK